MGRRRLQTILATTLLAVGLSTAPAFAQDLGGLTSTVEETVTSTTDEVTGAVEDTAEDLLGSDGDSTTDDGSTDDGTTDGGTTDGGTTDLTDDGDDAPLSTDLEVDLAPQDEDGSPQLEVDGGVTVGDQTIDVGGATDPIEDAVDPDPAPETESETGDTSSGSTEQDETDTSGTSRDRSRPGGFLEGGGVTAAGGDPRPADRPGSDGAAGSGSTFAESFAAFGALNGRFGLQRFDGGTMAMRGQQQVAPPEVAAPLADEEPFEPLVAEEPQTADSAREVAELAMQPSGPLGGDGSPLPVALKGFAAALLGATAFRAKRVLDQA